MLSKTALILVLFAGLLASSHVATGSAAGIAARNAARKVLRPPHGAAARATERKLLLFASHEKLLRRFVDRTTGLVKRNVAAHCARLHRRPFHRLPRFVCHVWTQPRSPSTGIAVVCHTKHHVFRVTPHHRRRHRRWRTL